MQKTIGDLISKARLDQQKKADLAKLEEMPDIIKASSLYDPNYVVKPLEFEGMKTGIETLDDGLLGVGKGELVFMGAPTNIGKTTIALYVALNFAAQGEKVIYMLAEDSTAWATDLLNTLVKSNPQLEKGIERVDFITDDDAMKFIGQADNLVALINSLSIDYGYGWFFLDMLNNIMDPLEDKNFGRVMTVLRQNANQLGHSLWFNCRFREPKAATNSERLREIHSPDLTMFYGKSTQYMFSVTKALALVPCEYSLVPGTRNLLIKILKNKRCRIGSIGMRHAICVDNNLKIWQPAGAVLAPEVGTEE